MAVFLMPIGNGSPIALDKTVLFIGRHPDCDVVLTNSRKISRKHCCIAQVDNRLVIRDLGSMNGIRVNGKKVKKTAPINLGDEISVGDLRFTMQVDDVPRSNGSNGSQKHVGTAAEEKSQPDPKPAKPQPIQPLELSGDFPVAIPEEGDEFAVEETFHRQPAPLLSLGDSGLSDVIPLAESSVNDVIPLDDSIEVEESESHV
jgi:pSer/pThr/pTyr-binding forkhead associated (FHA) protein